MNDIIRYNDLILNYLLEYRKQHPDFTFSLRERDSPQAKGVKRLEAGQWFQGSNYIYVPLFKKGDNSRKIKSIGFVVSFNEDGTSNNYIEISFKDGNFNETEKILHRQLADFLGISLDRYNVGSSYFEKQDDIIGNLNYYIDEFRTKALSIINELGLQSKYIIEIGDFKKRLAKTLSLRNQPNLKDIKYDTMKWPLNQILYGPPGTGKTYALKNRYFDHFTIRESELSKEQFMQQVLTELSWWQVITLVLLEKGNARVREIYDHPFIQIKENISKSKTVLQTLWGQLQSHTLMNCKNVNVIRRTEPLYFWKNENSIWSVKEDLVRELYPDAYLVLDELNNFKPSIGREVKLYNFVTFHQSYSYEDFIEGIKPNLEEGNDEVSYKIEDGIFKILCRQAENNPKYDYALFIDEINRGNVSAIFGELITLIEESKRKPVRQEDRDRCRETIVVTLPYSKDKFCVPSNLYIIGTMNTADRSVEALDTALRRRFAFEEMMPEPVLLNTNRLIYEALWKYEKVDWGEQKWVTIEEGLNELYSFNEKWHNSKEELWASFQKIGKEIGDREQLSEYHENLLDLENILTIINRRIEVLLDRNHRIGHSYFIDVKNLSDLKAVFYDKVIPLLQEYFYGDYGKIGLVLGSGFIKKETVNADVFADFEPELADNFEEKPIYYIKDYRNSNDLQTNERFKQAVLVLLK